MGSHCASRGIFPSWHSSPSSRICKVPFSGVGQHCEKMHSLRGTFGIFPACNKHRFAQTYEEVLQDPFLPNSDACCPSSLPVAFCEIDKAYIHKNTPRNLMNAAWRSYLSTTGGLLDFRRRFASGERGSCSSSSS